MSTRYRKSDDKNKIKSKGKGLNAGTGNCSNIYISSKRHSQKPTPGANNATVSPKVPTANPKLTPAYPARELGIKDILKRFFITLGAVLGVGIVVIVILTLPRYLKTHTEEEVNFLSFVEAIPETLATVQEPLTEIEEEPKGKYDDVLSDPEYMSSNNIYTREGAEDGKVSLMFTGDMLFDDEYAVMSSLKIRGGELSSSIPEETLEVMRSADILTVNNEFPYTERGTRQEDKKFTFRADLDTVNYLNDLGADVAILANNHVYDFGEQGLIDTLDTLGGAGVIPLGAGRNIKEASRPVYFIVNDIKVALIAATEIEQLDIPNTKGATEDSPGVFRSWNSDLIYSVIAEAKENADFVIVCMHWGRESESEPDYWQTLKAPKIVEAGADVIIGDHPHVLQGVYYFGDVPCIYSLGNYWFNGKTQDTGLVELKVTKEGLESFRFIPAVQSNYSTHIAEGEDKTRILNSMRALSPQAVISEDGIVRKSY